MRQSRGFVTWSRSMFARQDKLYISYPVLSWDEANNEPGFASQWRIFKRHHSNESQCRDKSQLSILYFQQRRKTLQQCQWKVTASMMFGTSYSSRLSVLCVFCVLLEMSQWFWQFLELQNYGLEVPCFYLTWACVICWMEPSEYQWSPTASCEAPD